MSNLYKYTSRNLLVRFAIKNFLFKIDRILNDKQFRHVIDVGCGEGFVSQHLQKVFQDQIRIHGIDRNQQALRIAGSMQACHGLIQGDIMQLPVKNNTVDLVLCTEVLEHITRVETALQEIKRITRDYCLLSVPSEYLFRFCRLLGLKNINGFGRHPQHIQVFTKKSFRRIVSRHFHVERIEFSFPWLIMLCRKRDNAPFKNKEG